MFEGADLLIATLEEMQAIRGARIAMILQDSLASLNPAFTIGNQVGETISLRERLRGGALRQRVIEELANVHIADPAARLRVYPHALSGGMRQRVAGAIALTCRPSLLIADEPTTALDVTVQAQYLSLLKEVQRRSGMSMIFVTHDFGVVARMCDRVAVMYAGRIIETGTTQEIFYNPRHPYTQALLACLPRLDGQVHDLASIGGQPPDLTIPNKGCRFAPRCTFAKPICGQYPPESVTSETHRVNCWRAEELVNV